LCDGRTGDPVPFAHDNDFLTLKHGYLRAIGALQQFIDRLFDGLERDAAGEPIHLFAVLEKEVGRQGHHFQFHAEAPIFRGLHFRHLDLPCIRGP
jgi:hypothetical protein